MPDPIITVVEELLSLNMSPLHTYGMMFIIGSLTVASLSDIRRMAAQRDFAEVWIAFAIVVFSYDVSRAIVGAESDVWYFLAKWGVILVMTTLSWQLAKKTFSLALMDVAAILAVISLLNPLYVIIFYLLLLVMNEVLESFLRKFGNRRHYPFLPVVLVSTVLMLGFGWAYSVGF